MEIFILTNFILMFFSVVEVVWAQYLEKRHFKNTRRFVDYSSRIIFPLVFIDLNVGLLIYYAAASTNGTVIWYTVACIEDSIFRLFSIFLTFFSSFCIFINLCCLCDNVHNSITNSYAKRERRN